MEVKVSTAKNKEACFTRLASTFGPMPGVLPGLNLGLAAPVATVTQSPSTLSTYLVPIALKLCSQVKIVLGFELCLVATYFFEIGFMGVWIAK